MSRERAFRTRRFGAVFVLSAVSASPTASASERGIEPVRLTWTRAPEAESCPDGPAIETDVARRLGTNPFRPDATGAIDVHVTFEQGVWSAAIEFRPTDGPPGSRSVTSTAPSCESLALAAGLAIALTIREQASAEPEPAPAPPPAPPPCPPRAPAPTPPEEREHVTALVAATGAFGLLPRAALGGSLLGRVPLSERFSLAASLSFLPEQRVSAVGGSYAFGATFAGLTPCFDLLDAPHAAASVCASVLLGAVHVVVLDATPVGPGARLWAAGGLGLRLDWNPSDALHLIAGVDALAPFQRHDYVVERAAGAETVFTEPALGALLMLGIGVEP